MTDDEKENLIMEILDLGSTYDKNRDFLTNLFQTFGWSVAYNEMGNYDESRDGFLVFKTPDEERYLKINLQEDSYSGGYYDGYSWVQPKTKTKTIQVWE